MLNKLRFFLLGTISILAVVVGILRAIPSEAHAIHQMEGIPVERASAVENILKVVRGFAQQEEVNLLGKEGWLHISRQEYMPTEMRGNGSPQLPMSQLYPEDTMFPENWYHVDGTGVYHEALALTMTADGAITQKSISVNGSIVNLTARAAGFTNGEYESAQSLEKVWLPAADALHMLEQMQGWSGSLSASQTGDEYVVIYERLYEESMVDSITQEPIAGEKILYTFDGNTGQLLSREFQSLRGGTWEVLHKVSYLTTEFMKDLPSDVAQIFNNALNSLQED